MKRRQFINTTLGAGLVCASLPLAKKARAHDGDEKLELTSEISRNHNHEAHLHLDDLVLLLRKVQDGATTTLDIKGSGTHSHTLELEESDILELLVEGELTLRSSVDAGHAHTVTFELSEIKK